jgi:hypothetical protein
LNSQESKDPLLLGIWGIGGIGKTTIAKAVYNKIHRDFEAKSFLLNVREVWKQDNGKVSLQQKLLSDIYKTTNVKIDTVESGKMILQDILCQKRIFLVLDDVNGLDQLNALCGSRKWFGQGSKIIITTRDDDLLCRLKVDHSYKMKEMDDNESIEHFNWHAFKQPNPIEGFADLSRDVVMYSRGLPLSLQVMGSSLSTRKTKTEWTSELKKLKSIDIDADNVHQVLSLSFDNLSDNDLKETFLNIACLNLSGMYRDDLIQIFEKDGHFTKRGLNTLVQSCLVDVDSENMIKMHVLVEEVGRKIRKEKSTAMAEVSCKIWFSEALRYLIVLFFLFL